MPVKNITNHEIVKLKQKFSHRISKVPFRFSGLQSNHLCFWVTF